MYFPANMNFQYFFFDTYPGYFLQMLPFAIIAGSAYGFIRFRKGQDTPALRKVMSVLLVCYLTGLIGLVALLDIVSIFWYSLFYHMDSGVTISFMNGDFNLVPDFFHHLSGETIANLAMFVPFGVLYPLSQKNPSWKKSILAGIICTVVIEVLQPIFGRAFDINDIIMNTLGVLIATTAFFACKMLRKKMSILRK